MGVITKMVWTSYDILIKAAEINKALTSNSANRSGIYLCINSLEFINKELSSGFLHDLIPGDRLPRKFCMDIRFGRHLLLEMPMMCLGIQT